ADTLRAVPGIKTYGITDPARFDERVATFSFRLAGVEPRRIAEELDKDGIYAWDGNYYALEVTRRLDVEDKGGMLRVGAVHYNTLAEIERFGKSLARIAKI
ncbi:MAG: aminotransferase class V-fold PLP-dependent enzyme, partial [Candidatus Aminicenantales bacterium]